MARLISGIHDSIYMTDSREPVYKCLLYDQTDSLSDIVLGRATQSPLDITQFVKSCSVNEQEDSATTASLTIAQDTSSTLTPYNFVSGKIIRIKYTDASLPDNDWIWMFTGVCIGQPGYKRSREGHEITVSCQDRSSYYKGQKLETSKYDKGEDIGEMAVDIATNTAFGFDLDREECRFGLFRHDIEHTEISLYDVGKMEGLEFLGFIVDLKPGWDGEGHLVFRNTDIEKSPLRKYANDSLFLDITWPQGDTNVYNKIRVIGLSSDMSKVVSPDQELTTIRGTVGYFQTKYNTRVYYSEDRQGRAENIYISSYNMDGQLSSLLGLTGSIALSETDEFSCVLVVSTPYQAWLFLGFFAIYIAFFMLGALFSFFSSAAMIAAAIWLCVGLALMQKLGSFEATISGTPYKMVYAEIEGTAEWANLRSYEINEKVIENHLVHDQALADAIALRELKREKVKGMQRTIKMLQDPVLEQSDIIELSDGSRYYIKSISRQFARAGISTMDVSAFLIRSGLESDGEEGFTVY